MIQVKFGLVGWKIVSLWEKGSGPISQSGADCGHPSFWTASGFGRGFS